MSVVYRFGYGGHEKDNEIKGEGNSYDMGARLYDPRIGRTPTIDPLARKFPHESPYIYAGNNPVFYVDVDGKEKITYYTVIDDQGNEAYFKVIDEDYVELKNVYRNPGDKGYSFWSDVGNDFTSSGEPASGYLEEDVKHDVYIQKTISLEDLQVVDENGEVRLDFSKATETGREEVEQVDNSHWMDGWPGVTFYGDGDLDLGTKRKASSMTDVTDLIEVIKVLGGGPGKNQMDNFKLKPGSLEGAYTIADKAGTTGIDDSNYTWGDKKTPIGITCDLPGCKGDTFSLEETWHQGDVDTVYEE